jgi:hypothetical protein
MLVDRHFTPKLADGSGGDVTSSTERFERIPIFKPMDE